MFKNFEQYFVYCIGVGRLTCDKLWLISSLLAMVGMGWFLFFLTKGDTLLSEAGVIFSVVCVSPLATAFLILFVSSFVMIAFIGPIRGLLMWWLYVNDEQPSLIISCIAFVVFVYFWVANSTDRVDEALNYS
jgi:hypothetical protein